jgi:hypothetical protein
MTSEFVRDNAARDRGSAQPSDASVAFVSVANRVFIEALVGA